MQVCFDHNVVDVFTYAEARRVGYREESLRLDLALGAISRLGRGAYVSGSPWMLGDNELHVLRAISALLTSTLSWHVSGWSALALLGVDVSGCDLGKAYLTRATPTSTMHSSAAALRWSAPLAEGDLTLMGAVPTVVPDLALYDVARREHPEVAARITRQLIAHGLVEPQAVEARALRGSRRHIGRIRAVLDAVDSAEGASVSDLKLVEVHEIAAPQLIYPGRQRPSGSYRPTTAIARGQWPRSLGA